MPTDYLLIPGAPTPNGRLHLGHIGGQFLKLDVFKRHALRAGDRALLCFSLDTYDTPIYLMAQEQGRTEAEVCRVHVEGIREDLANLAIDYDVLLDTSTPQGREVIGRTAAELDQLVTPNKVSVVEKAAYSRTTGRPLVGRALTSQCPKCGRTLRGFACDPCGLYLSIETVRDVRAADPADSLDLRDVTNHYVRARSRAIREYADGLALPAVTRGKFDEVADLLLRDEEFRTRWTASVPYGIGTGVPGQVFFNYMLVTLGEQITFGAMAAERFGSVRNAFDADSGIVTVGAYGADNLAVFLVDNVAQALATGRFRPFDHQLVSEFWTVDGEKISKSLTSSMWVSDVAVLPGFSRDGIRGYLLSVAEPDREVDLTMPALRSFVGSLDERLDRVVAAASARPVAGADPDVVALAGKAVDAQAAALDLARMDLPAVWRTVEEWLDRVEGSGGSYAALAGFAAVASPALPDTAAAVWDLLGLDGQPCPAALRRCVADGR